MTEYLEAGSRALAVHQHEIKRFVREVECSTHLCTDVFPCSLPSSNQHRRCRPKMAKLQSDNLERMQRLNLPFTLAEEGRRGRGILMCYYLSMNLECLASPRCRSCPARVDGKMKEVSKMSTRQVSG